MFCCTKKEAVNPAEQSERTFLEREGGGTANSVVDGETDECVQMQIICPRQIGSSYIILFSIFLHNKPIFTIILFFSLYTLRCTASTAI